MCASTVTAVSCGEAPVDFDQSAREGLATPPETVERFFVAIEEAQRGWIELLLTESARKRLQKTGLEMNGEDVESFDVGRATIFERTAAVPVSNSRPR